VAAAREANVIFFEKKEGRAEAWTDKLWVYDLRTNQHFTLKQKPIRRSDFDEFTACYKPGRMHERAETWSEANSEGRWRCFDYDELLKRDKLDLNLFWIKDKSLTDTPASAQHHRRRNSRWLGGCAGTVHQDRSAA
jgi:type I restriction enzyme M protein